MPVPIAAGSLRAKLKLNLKLKLKLKLKTNLNQDTTPKLKLTPLSQRLQGGNLDEL